MKTALKEVVVGSIYSIDIKKLKPQRKKNAEMFPMESGRKMKLVSNSIKNYGQDRAIEIRPDYTIVCGHNRYVAALEAGLKRVNCIVKSFNSEAEEEAFMLRENCVRRQFSRQQKTEIIKRYIKRHGEKSPSELTNLTGIPISTVQTILSSLKVNDEIKGIRHTKKSHIQRKLETISNRYSATRFEVRHFPLKQAKLVVRKTEEHLKYLKSIERDIRRKNK